MVEGILFLALALGFAWWQMREIRQDQEQTRRRREAEGSAPQGGADAGDAAQGGDR